MALITTSHAPFHAEGNHDEAVLPQNTGVPPGVAEGDSWIDTEFRHVFHRVGGRDGIVRTFKRRVIDLLIKAGPQLDISGDTFTADGAVSGPTLDVDGYRIVFTTAATIDDSAGLEGLSQYVGFHQLLGVFNFQLPGTGDCRAFVGFTNNTLVTQIGTDSDPAGHYFGLQYDSTRDTNWQFVNKDNVTQQLNDEGTAVDTDVHTVVMYYDNDNSKLVFQLDGGTQATETLNLPGSTTLLRFCVAIATSAAAAKAIELGASSFESDS